jgi:phosphatidylglycerophosphate synthase
MVSRDLFSDTLSHIVVIAGGLAAALLLTQGPGRGLALALALYAAIAAVALAGLSHHPFSRFGVANAVTLSRSAILAAIIGLFAADPEPEWILSALAFAGLALDGIDGWAARRRRTASAYGARFDLEVDALSVLALSLIVALGGRAGPWVVGLGLMRYGFVLAGRAWPALSQPLPPRSLRKVIYVFVVSALAAALAPVPAFLAASLCAAAGLALIYSFGSDCVWLLRAARMTRPVSRLRQGTV